MDLNKSIIAGRAVRDADVRATSNGSKVATFTLASSGLNDNTNFIDIVCWNKKADFAERFVRKGEKFAVSGRISQRSYEDKQGNKRYAFEIVCEDIYFWGSKDAPSGDSAVKMTQAQALNGGKDFVVEDIDDKEIDMSQIPF